MSRGAASSQWGAVPGSHVWGAMAASFKAILIMAGMLAALIAVPQMLAPGSDWVNRAMMTSRDRVLCAVGQGQTAVIRDTLAGNVNAPLSAAGETALMLAAENRRSPASLAAVLACAPNLDQPDRYGCTALMFAARCGNMEGARLLLNAGASPDARDANGLTAADYAAWHSHRELAKLLLGHGQR